MQIFSFKICFFKILYVNSLERQLRGLTDDRFPLDEMNGDFTTKFIHAYAFLFVHSFAEIFLFRQKKLPLLWDQSKQKYNSLFVLSANTFLSDQIENDC